MAARVCTTTVHSGPKYQCACRQLSEHAHVTCHAVQANFDLGILCGIVAGLDAALCAKIFACLKLDVRKLLHNVLSRPLLPVSHALDRGHVVHGKKQCALLSACAGLSAPPPAAH